MDLNPFNADINNKIKIIIQNIIPKIKTNGEFCIVNENGKDWQYNTSKEYLDKNKNFLLKYKEPYTNEYLLSFYDDVKLIQDNLISLIQELYPNKKTEISGHFYYPKEGYMGWHTNWNSHGKRLYIVYASEDKKSFFRYLKDGEIVTSYDNKGITIREFDIPKPPNYFWHCVGSECDRYSFGFKITELLPE